MTKILRVGGVCSGIGGFELGLVRAGFEIAWMVEIDEFCQKVLKKHAPAYWPNAKILGDIKNVGKHNLESVNVLCGGIPCQPHSLAGKRGGAADDRDLWPEYRRLVTELRPAWVIIENVPGIIGTILDAVLSDLENLNYSAQSFIIPACAIGAPHRRDRVFIVAYSDSTNGYGRAGDVQMGRQRHTEKAKTNGDTQGIQWQLESPVGRVANGIPHRMDRLRGLGNALVPQAAEFLGRLIMKVEQV